MTASTDRTPGGPETAPRVGPRWSTAGLVLGATAMSMAMMAPLLGTVLHGGFADPDDAMRLVEVRAWLAGQPWFDVTALRLDPPSGASMHWSRLVDLPVAVFVTVFGWMVERSLAEGLARIVVPLLLLLGLYAGMARLASIVTGPRSIPVALVGLVLTGVTLVQVQPGRIGHHGPETVALVWAVATLLASFDPQRARQALIAGVLVALDLAMSLETLPFLGALCAGLGLIWACRGAVMAASLRWFALGFGTALPILFLATVPIGRWGAPVCDAYGGAHVGAGMIGAAGLLVLAAVPNRRVVVRLGALAGLGCLVVSYVAVAFPTCLRSPFAGVDPLVRDLWLDHVVESKPLPVFLHAHLMVGLAIVVPMSLGLAALVAAAGVWTGVAAWRVRLLAGLVATGLVLGFWQVRVLGSIAPLALVGGLVLVEFVRRRTGGALAAIAPGLILPFTATAWALALPDDPPVANETKIACLAASALAPLATLPPGRAIGPIDLGSHLIEATKLDLFDAPYHRNDDGNRYAYDVFLASPDAARTMLLARDTRYVILCPGMGDIARLASRAPEGLAAALASGRVPDWLGLVPLAGTPYAVFTVRRPAG